MTVQALFETFLIHVMANKSYAAAQNEQRVDRADINVLLCFLTESAKVS